VAGFGAGTVATLVMHPLDLVKVRFQLATVPSGTRYHHAPTRGPASSTPLQPIASSSNHPLAPPQPQVIPATRARLGTGVYLALRDAVRLDGWTGLYRGLVPNLVGGASSWGLYFLL
jgi:solute carrier family 25 folate transporter 32